MQIDQVLLRPNDKIMVIRYADSAGRLSNMAVEKLENDNAAKLVSDCEKLLPSEAERPEKSEIEQEIDELEYRLEQLKKSIGQA